MATIQELMEQYRSTLPDYLANQNKSAAEVRLPKLMDRAPAGLKLGQTAKSETKIEQPEIEKQLKALNVVLAGEQEKLSGLYAASEEARAQQKLKASEEAGKQLQALMGATVNLPKTTAAIEEQRKRLEEISQRITPKPQEADLFGQALLAFLPALAGFGLGKAIGGVGVAETGGAGGAAAGTEAIRSVQQQRKERADREAEAAKALLQREAGVSKEYIDAVRESELFPAKVLQAGSIAGMQEMFKSMFSELNQKAAKGALSPEEQKLQNQLKYIETLQKQQAGLLGAPGKKTVTKQFQQEGGAAPGGEIAGGFYWDPNKAQTKLDEKEGKAVISAWRATEDSLNRVAEEAKVSAITMPVTERYAKIRAALGSVITNLKKSVINTGANWSINEERLMNEYFPTSLSASVLAQEFANPGLLARRAQNLKADLLRQVKVQVEPYGILHRAPATETDTQTKQVKQNGQVFNVRMNPKTGKWEEVK
jgi:hypothetical protein